MRFEHCAGGNHYRYLVYNSSDEVIGIINCGSYFWEYCFTFVRGCKLDVDDLRDLIKFYEENRIRKKHEL